MNDNAANLDAEIRELETEIAFAQRILDKKTITLRALRRLSSASAQHRLTVVAPPAPLAVTDHGANVLMFPDANFAPEALTDKPRGFGRVLLLGGGDAA